MQVNDEVKLALTDLGYVCQASINKNDGTGFTIARKDNVILHINQVVEGKGYSIEEVLFDVFNHSKGEK